MEGEFVRKANIAEFRGLLATTTDEYLRRTLFEAAGRRESEGAPLVIKGEPDDS
jgi:hypothetical protein